MELTEAVKRQIDGMSYEAMLSRWRFAPIGEPLFLGPSGDYFEARMKALRDADPAEHVRASKAIGWDR